MSEDIHDLLPPPEPLADGQTEPKQDTLEIGRGENGGWFVTINNERLLICRSSIREVAEWLTETFGPLDRGLDELVAAEEQITRPIRPRKSLFQSWRRDH